MSYHPFCCFGLPGRATIELRWTFVGRLCQIPREDLPQKVIKGSTERSMRMLGSTIHIWARWRQLVHLVASVGMRDSARKKRWTLYQASAYVKGVLDRTRARWKPERWVVVVHVDGQMSCCCRSHHSAAKRKSTKQGWYEASAVEGVGASWYRICAHSELARLVGSD